MASDTKIAWCDATFQPWIGCTKVSPGCANCYAEAHDKRFGGEHWGVGVPRRRTTEANWRKPLAWDRAARKAGERHRVFCASLADVFDSEVPVSWLSDLARLIDATPHLDWLLLTKRPENYWRWKAATAQNASDAICWPSNVWLGVTVENQEQAEKRIPLLLAQDAVVRFLSCEPLLSAVDLSEWLHDKRGAGILGASGSRLVGGVVHRPAEVVGAPALIDQVIIGGESGPKARPFDVAWARSLVAQCRLAGVAPFVKQLGARPIAYHGNGTDWDELRFRDSHGGDPGEWPEDLRVREFPRGGR